MNKTNPRLTSLITTLESVARESEANVWEDVAERLAKPGRTHAEVNLSRIERYADGDRTIVVPGKVLGSGVLQKEVTIAAVDFSRTAERKIEAANATLRRLEDEVDQNPNGHNVQVIG